MNAVQSVWLYERPNETRFDYACGWLSPFFHLASWALSSWQLSRLFPAVQLMTDSVGEELATELNLPYTSVSNHLNEQKRNSRLWVSNKLYTYAIQTEPFLHIDTDAYLFSQLPLQLLTAPLFAQNFEYDHYNYCQAYQDILQYCSYIPDLIQKDKYGRLTAVNAGVIGGTNVTFFKEFKRLADQFIDRNGDLLTKCDYDYLNVFVEQYLFMQLATKNTIPVSFITPKEFGPPCDYRMTDFKSLPNDCHYIHITNYKRNPTVCEQMAQRLWLESPELYERALLVSKHLEATHHAVSLPGDFQTSAFYRTCYLLHTLELTDGQNTLTDEQLLQIIASLPDAATQTVLQDVFEFEQGRAEVVSSLPPFPQRWEYWRACSQRTNNLLLLPSEQYTNVPLLPGRYNVRLSSEWNWAEANEFAGQTADRDLAQNLRIEPSYFETLLYYYPHQQLVREQVLDVLNILILDALEEQPLSMNEVISAVSEQVLSYQAQVNLAELTETIISRIRHFLYHGVIDVSA